MITGALFVEVIVSVPPAPPPWPTTLIAMVAIPWAPKVAPTAHGAPCLLSVKPWPKIATGQPSAGGVPRGRNRLNCRVLFPCTAGTPVRVPTGGMNCSLVSQFGDSNWPKATAPTDGPVGNTLSAGTGKKLVANDEFVVPVLIWRDH